MSWLASALKCAAPESRSRVAPRKTEIGSSAFDVNPTKPDLVRFLNEHADVQETPQSPHSPAVETVRMSKGSMLCRLADATAQSARRAWRRGSSLTTRTAMPTACKAGGSKAIRYGASGWG